ncbi:MAG: GNAT family N-acetyltransferase, partial [Chloroflexota bacterium]|nr:GNAT family N-acetyltransferase [Chloroflexota bacterium]
LGVAVVEEPGARRAYGTGIKMLASLWRQTGPGVLLRSLRHLLRISANRPREPHHRLSLIAVQPQAQGQGYGKALLAEVHARVEAHPTSRGISLDTENPQTVPLYEHLGYHVTHQIAAGPLTIWGMFRPRGEGQR